MNQQTPAASSLPSGYGRAVWTLVALALLLRLFHYLRNPAVWCDELWLLRNITGKSFGELLGPLSDAQAAPPLFLWFERVMWLVFGDNIFAMRFISVFSSCVSVFLFLPLARQSLRTGAIVWALVLFGFCDQMTRYTCDVKPYATDAMLALALPFLLFATRHWSLEYRLMPLALLAPFAIFLSYPSCFVYGGIMVAMLATLYENRLRWQAWGAYAFLVVMTIGSFAILYYGPIRAQRSPDLDACWVDFPDWHRPWSVPIWSLDAINRLFEQLWRPTGSVLMVSAVIGVISMWRRSARVEVAVLGLPFLLVLFASWIRTYPFEGRVVFFTMPALSLFCGEGLSVLWELRKPFFACWRDARNGFVRIAAPASVILMLALNLIPLSQTLYHVVRPLPRLTNEVWPEPRE